MKKHLFKPCFSTFGLETGRLCTNKVSLKRSIMIVRKVTLTLDRFLERKNTEN